MVRVGVWNRASVSKTVRCFVTFCHSEASKITSSDFQLFDCCSSYMVYNVRFLGTSHCLSRAVGG